MKTFSIDEIPAIRKERIQHSINKFGIKCSACNELWMVGDRERTEEEKEKWMCPNCEQALAEDSVAEEIEETTGEKIEDMGLQEEIEGEQDDKQRD